MRRQCNNVAIVVVAVAVLVAVILLVAILVVAAVLPLLLLWLLLLLLWLRFIWHFNGAARTSIAILNGSQKTAASCKTHFQCSPN